MITHQKQVNYSGPKDDTHIITFKGIYSSKLATFQCYNDFNFLV